MVGGCVMVEAAARGGERGTAHVTVSGVSTADWPAALIAKPRAAGTGKRE